MRPRLERRLASNSKKSGRANGAGRATASHDAPVPTAKPPHALEALDQLRFRVEQLEAEVTRAQRLSLLGTMVGVIAHEFNNILTPVLSYCQLAKSRPDDAALTAKALDRAAAGAEKAARIATAILELTRDDRLSGPTGQSGLPQQAAACDVRSAIRDVLLSMAREPEKDGISVSIEGEGHSLARIRPVALHHVLLNLVINARKAMVGGGRLTFRYAECSTWNTPGGEAVPWVVLEVEDTGCGIPKGVLTRLFEPFATEAHGGDVGELGGVDSAESRGTGLGLTISKRLVEEAGGSIRASSQRGVGTRFTLRLRAA